MLKKYNCRFGKAIGNVAAMVENAEAEESSRDETLGAIAAAYDFKNYSLPEHDYEQEMLGGDAHEDEAHEV